MTSEIHLSVVIPVYNMGEYLAELVASLERSGVLELCEEVILVNDGSTDQTLHQAQILSLKTPKFRVHDLGQNRGRYVARLEGAQAARTDHLLFLDARLNLSSDFATQIKTHWATSDFLQPQARIDIHRNRFCLYWDRSHRAIYRHHFKTLENGPVDLTPENYELFLKGTTAIVMPRDLFLQSCKKIGNELLSDDTALIRLMVETRPLRLVPDLWFWWVPRETWAAFLWRLYDRGPGLVEYHVFSHRGWIFWSIFIGLVGLASFFFLLLTSPFLFLKAAVFALVLAALSTRWLALSWKETLQLMPLHVAVLFAVGLGILKGLVVNLRRWFKGELNWSTE